MDGSDLQIISIEKDGNVVIGDGERTALYEPTKGNTPIGASVSISPAYVEAGWFSEANCITLTDGQRKAVYVPVRKS